MSISQSSYFSGKLFKESLRGKRGEIFNACFCFLFQRTRSRSRRGADGPRGPRAQEAAERRESGPGTGSANCPRTPIRESFAR